MFARQLGWLHGRPDKKGQKCRGELINTEDVLPPLVRSRYLIEFAFLIGFDAISWETVRAFSVMADYDLAGWEAEALVLIGREYRTALAKHDRRPSPPPWRDTKTIDRAAVASAARAAFRTTFRR